MIAPRSVRHIEVEGTEIGHLLSDTTQSRDVCICFIRISHLLTLYLKNTMCRPSINTEQMKTNGAAMFR